MNNILTGTILSVLLMTTVACGCNGGADDGFDFTYQVETLPAWKEGYLDIHHINTGRGNCSFMILPDGTTMLVDVGDVGSESFQEITPARPDDAKTPATWVAEYINYFTRPLQKAGDLDYAVMSHFHNDHIGGEVNTAVSQVGKSYKLSGITELANLLDIDLLVDRGYPLYNYYPDNTAMINENKNTLPNYSKFIEERDKLGKKTEMFEVGSNTQFVLKQNPSAYPDFEIRNVCGNGMVWTGSGNSTRTVYPSSSFKSGGENSASCGFVIKYGRFGYCNCADIQGENNSGGAVDMETAVSEIMPPCEVVLCNHHAFSDAMHEKFISATRPKVYVIPVWGINQPTSPVMKRMLDTGLYPGDRMIFATGRLDNNDKNLGEYADDILQTGHIVIRVYEGGGTYQIFVLSDTTRTYQVIYKSDIMTAE